MLALPLRLLFLVVISTLHTIPCVFLGLLVLQD